VLFSIPSVDTLVKAMQYGAHDAWWVSRGERGVGPLDHLLKEWLEKTPVSNGFSPLLLSRLAKSISMQAASREISFFEARREFSKALIREISRRHRLPRGDLAKWMGVSVRTIQRLLSDDE
jgi:hypothetical protein